MNKESLCTEQQAMAISGVSSRTLLRFSEAGYLTVHVELDGSRRYQRTQVEEIFGVASSGSPANAAQADTSPANDMAPQGQTPPQEPGVPAREGTSAQGHSSATPSVSSVEPTVHTNPSLGMDTNRNAEEISRLRNLLALQERILDSKDDEIADLRSQRAWLRERIEKLEEKSDRDQILLLSETQTIRSLLAYQESRKSTFRQLLEWTGLLKTPQSTALPQPNDYHAKAASAGGSSRTIEVAKAANSD